MEENSKTNHELLKKSQSGDKEALNKFILENQKLLHSLLQKYRYFNVDYEDLLSAANVGLLGAAQKFDFSFNVTFSTYAVPLILGEVKKYIRDQNAIHVSRSVKELYCDIVKKENELMNNLNRSPSLNELADSLNQSVEDILEAIESHQKIASLDEPIIDNQDISLSDLIEDISLNQNNLDLSWALDQLDKKERLFIDLRFYQGYNQDEIAKRFMTSQVQISRLEKKIIEKLKSKI